MDFVSNQEEQIKEMLRAIGVSSVDELFSAVPESIRLSRPALEDGLSEMEGLKAMEKIAAYNTASSLDCYLGAGAYEHYVPALVAAITQKSEFLTAYTPYQAEVSQGLLQATFEFQSAVCALTGLPVANASVYDAASACAEALLMALRQQRKRSRVLVSEGLHPNYRAVVDQYLSFQDVSIETIPCDENGLLKEDVALGSLDENVAALLVQSPNFFGVVEQVAPVFSAAREKGVLPILCANPLSFGLYASPAELGAAIAVGDMQPFGIPLQFGGPYVGYVACEKALTRQLPGRVVGETEDRNGKSGYVLTLQAREQHIRREKATSNICTNQALAALASLVAVLWYGKKGVQKLALTNYQRANYLREQLMNLPGIQGTLESPIFNEFMIQINRPIEQVLRYFQNEGIQAGVAVSDFYPERANSLLVAVTETKNRQQLDHYLSVMRQFLVEEVE